jgi:polyhydroxyalkanoate synthesis regulator phasin
MPRGIEFNDEINTWVDKKTGDPLSHDDLLIIRNEGLDYYANQMVELADKLVKGDITLQQFADLMRDIIYEANLMQFAVGRGGQSRMTDNDFAVVVTNTNNQLSYLDEWLADMQKNGVTAVTVSAAEKITTRGLLYLGSTNLSYEIGKASSWGVEELPSYPTLPYKDYSWCYMNCKCHWEFKSSKGDEIIAKWVRTVTDSCEACKVREREFKNVKLKKEVKTDE